MVYTAGLGENDKSGGPIKESMDDVDRVKYISGYLDALAAAFRYQFYQYLHNQRHNVVG